MSFGFKKTEKGGKVVVNEWTWGTEETLLERGAR